MSDMTRPQISVVIAAIAVFFAWLPVTAAEPQWGSLQGRVVYGGEPPVRKKLAVAKEKYCEKFDILDEQLLVDPKGRGLANVFVWLRRPKDQEIQIHPDRAKEKEKGIEWTMRGCRFEPHVFGIQPGQKLTIVNNDSVGHNAKVDTFQNQFLCPLIPSTDRVDFQFQKEEALPSPAACTIHPWTSGWILIQDHPYFAITDPNGKFTIDKIPAGEWTFVFWHESFEFIKKPTVGGKQQDWPKGRKTIKLTAAGVDLGEIVLAPGDVKR